MKREDFDKLLKELTDENLTTDRQLEIFKTLQDDKDADLKSINDLTVSSDKLQNEFEALRKKKVEDFFNQGIESRESKKEFDNEGGTKEDQPSIDDLIEE